MADKKKKRHLDHVMCACAFRQTGMGFVSTMARIGSMAAPAVLILDEVMSLI